MDGKSLSQSSELTERSHRRRLSSILKAPRSPLKDLGSGNEPCQEPTVEKRRKSSRRVSFAETIRVFAPELQATGSADKENEGFGMSDSSSNSNPGTANKYGIAGMDTLLHGPIQVPGHNADWNYADCPKDRTIFFSSDNDMDMTASNTVTIHGSSEENTNKIDTTLFLASLKSQKSEDVANNKDFQLLTGVEKHSDFKRDSSVENKIKFSDFLASLGSEKSKPTNCLEDAEKENIFPFALTHFNTRDNTGNVTQMFREQDDGLELTKCHTTNIDSFLPLFNREIPSQFISTADNGSGQPKPESSHLKSLGPKNNFDRPSNDQTMLIENDMDITCSHTTRIRQDIPTQDAQLYTNQNKTVFSSDKTIIFGAGNEMEFTQNNSVLFNSKRSVTSIPQKDRAFFTEHTTILPQGEDMDITKSHTVAIDGLTMDQEKHQALSYSVPCHFVANDADIRLSSGPSLCSQMMPNKSLYNNDGPDGRYPHSSSDNPSQGKQVGQNKTTSTISNLAPLEKMFTDHSEKTVLFTCEQDEMELTKSHTIAIDGKHFQVSNKKDNKSYFSGLKLPSVSNKTILFSADVDDMELTRSHTVCIDQKALNQDDKRKVSLGFQQWSTSESISNHVQKPGMDFSDHRVMENTALLKATEAAKRKSILNATSRVSNDMEMTVAETEPGKSPVLGTCEDNKTVVFTCDQQDMEMTRSHTVSIDSKVLCESLQYNKNSSTTDEQDEMELTKSHTIAIDGKHFQESNKKDNKSYFSGLKLPSVSNKTILFSADVDDMELTQSHTVCIDQKALNRDGKSKISSGFQQWSTSESTSNQVQERDMCFSDQKVKEHVVLLKATDGTKRKSILNATSRVSDDMEMTVVETEPGKSPVSVTCEDNKTVMFTCDQQDMEITRSHTVSIDSKVLCEKLPYNNSRTIDGKHLQGSSKKDSKPYFSGLKLPSVSNKTILFSTDSDDMELTQSHTVCIDQKASNRINKSNASSGFQQWSTSESTTSHAEKPGVDCSDQRIKENITLLNKVTGATSSKRKSILNATSRISDDMEMTVAETEPGKRPLSGTCEDNRTVVFTCDQQDMEITRSHTVSIDNKVLSERLQYNTPNTNSSNISKCPETNNLKSKEQDGYSQAGKTTKSLFTLPASCMNPARETSSEKSGRESCPGPFRLDQVDMDMTYSGPFVYGNSKMNKSVPCVPSTVKCSAAEKTIFEDDMELTKSRTMVIDERNPVALHNPSISAKNITLPTSELDNVVTKPSTICLEMETAHKQQLPNDTVHQEGDMEMTNVNASLLTTAGKSQPWNKGNPLYESFKDKTMNVYNRDEMDMTRAHTVAIENKVIAEVGNAKSKTMLQNNATATSALVNKSRLSDVKYISRPHSTHGFEVLDYTSRTQLDQDMDFTVSNTVFIDNEKPQNDLQLPISTSKVLTSTGNHHLDLCKENVSRLERNTPVTIESQDKTLFLYEKNDMDITKSYTTAIESKILDNTKTINVITELQRTKKLTHSNSGLDVTSNAVHMADTTSMNRICSKGEDMDVTKSNTVFIDHVSNESVQVLDIVPKRKSVSSHPKSLVARDETILLVCNMEETNANVRLAESVVNKSSFDKTVCNQGDMEMTKSHTVAIENKILDTAHVTHPVRICAQVSKAMTSCDRDNTNVCDGMDKTRSQEASNDRAQAPLVSKPTSFQDLRMPLEKKDGTMTFSLMEKELKSIFTQSNKDLLLNSDETMFPSEEQSMDITKAHTAAVEVNFVDNNSDILSTSIDVIKGDTEVVNSVGTEQKHDRNEPNEKLEKCRRKSYAKSLSRSAKSEIFLETLGNDELTQIHTIPVDDYLLKTGPCDNTGTDLDKESDNINVGSDHKSKESGHAPLRSSVSANACPEPNSNFPDIQSVRSDCKVEGVAEYGISGDKSVYENGFKSQLLAVNGGSLKTTSELSPVSSSSNSESSCVTSNSKDIRPEEQTTCLLPLDAHHKDPEMAAEKEFKKAKLKGKRVSFNFPENEIVAKDVILIQVTEPSMLGEQDDQKEHQDRTAHVTDQISDFKSDFIHQASVVGTIQYTEILEENPPPKDPEISKIDVGFPEGLSSNAEGFGTLAEISEKSKNKRRSIADIQLKIKSLTQKSKMSPHHTAPVSRLVDQLPATTRISSDSAPEQESLPNTETVQAKEPNDEKNKIRTRENRLSNRLSVKIFPPRLPNRRASSTSHIVEPVSTSLSEAPTQNDQTSKALPKTFDVVEDGQRIDEEMLPACPDDQDVNSVLHYEVPEGAWEDLCQEEALQQNLNVLTSHPKDSMNGQKRVRDAEGDSESQREKRARWNQDIMGKDDAQTSMAYKGSDKSYRSDYSAHHASKTMEQTYSSSSSQDSRAEGMSVELSSQQYSQMDSQLLWDVGCEQNLWQKFQDGTITVQEFFALLRIRILIQKPRYSELPSKRGMNEDLTASEILLDQYVFQPKLQVYEEVCHTLNQTIEELKVWTERQHKPLVQSNSLLWEAMRMCSQNELMYFGVTLKNMKSLFSKKTKLLAHEEKVSTYSKLLHAAQTQWKKLQTRLDEIDTLLRELDDCTVSLEIETAKLDAECRGENLSGNVQGQIQEEIDILKSQEQRSIKESLELEERKQKVLGQLGCLQEEAHVMDKRLQEPSFTEWELVKWTDKEAAFIFLYDSLELFIMFGDCIDGENFNNQPCRRISSVTVESQLNDKVAPPSSLLVHRLILQYVEKKGAFHETYTSQNHLPQLLSDVSLAVSRCRLLGEELEYLIKWGAKYNIVKAQVQNHEVRLLFSSLAALVKFELIINLSDNYPSVPLAFTFKNHIGSIGHSRVTAIMSEVPAGLWYLKRSVKFIHENLLV